MHCRQAGFTGPSHPIRQFGCQRTAEKTVSRRSRCLSWIPALLKIFIEASAADSLPGGLAERFTKSSGAWTHVNIRSTDGNCQLLPDLKLCGVVDHLGAVSHGDVDQASSISPIA
jgi:hypothetical protein